MADQKVYVVTIQNIVIVVGSFLCGFYLTRMFHEPTSYIGGLWAAISGIIVVEGETSNTLKSARNRIIGTLTGAIVAGTYLLLFDFSIVGYAASIAVGVLLCYLFRIPSSIKLTGITISVILIVSAIEKDLHPVTNAGLRFAESALGTGVAVLVAFTVYYFRKKKQDDLGD